ncbi:MAG: M1 family metallopeptidase, partial [Bacteroidota bacterium]|nr:M1 family metallopeptidase [Bacteroidota bacterium]
MGKSLFLSCLAVCSLLLVRAQSWQQKVDFRIDVTLNDKEHSLDAFEKITYNNQSPDTLTYIWFHCWPNAYKNDRTAFSEQLLLNNRTDFYFSNKEQRGYINKLDFKVDGQTAKVTDHPQYIDVIKLWLPKPLLPGASITISTPFHVQLPENFSRGGHTGQSYQVTQWFPKPAVYDTKGWHPMPYLDQGEFYAEFGHYDVRITVPENYAVAATGQLLDSSEQEWLRSRKDFSWEPVISKTTVKKGSYHQVKKTVQEFPVSALSMKTLRFSQDSITDFAWFADKRYRVKQDSIQLTSGRMVRVNAFFLPNAKTPWNHATDFVKKAIAFRSKTIGEYPFPTITAVEAKMGFSGGMEYPTITSISPATTATELELTIEHEAGHNWFQGMLASNERDYPWMDEGINSYYDDRYKEETESKSSPATKFPESHIPPDPVDLILQS